MRHILAIICILAGACGRERAPEAGAEGAPADSVPADSAPARGDSMMARDTASPG